MSWASTSSPLSSTPAQSSRALLPPGCSPLAELGGLEIGVWELTSGAVHDTEADEVFVVVAGDATVRFADGESIELHPGVVVRLHAGDRTEWVVRSPLRKVYITPA